MAISAGKAQTKLGGEHPRATKSSRRPPGRQSESQAPFAEGARLGLSRRFARGGRGDGLAGSDLSRGLSVDSRRGLGQWVLAEVRDCAREITPAEEDAFLTAERPDG